MNNTTEEKLESYKKELSLEYFSIDSLIESHRYLREISIKYHDALREERVKAREHAFEYLKTQGEKYNWFSRERLLSMTIQQLVDVLEGCD
jgi:hypothetical protein